MKITELTTQRVDLPLPSPLRTSIHEIKSVSCLLVTLTSDEGITGEGYAFCFGREKLIAIEAMVTALKPHIIGADPFMTEAIWSGILKAMNFFGQGGALVLAMTPLDVACWDMVGKTLGQPLYRIFGGHRTSVPVYASGGLWLSSDLDGLQREAKAFMAAGFKAMKVRLGNLPVAANVARVEAIRDVVGPDFALMADANQGLTTPDAIRLGRALEPHGLVWFEEPIPTWDYAGQAEIAAALDTPLATGETEWIRYGIRNMLEKRAADILMPDLQRMGGYTEFRKVIGQMAAADVPFAPHIFTEHSLHLVASAAGGIYAEHMPWFEGLFNEAMPIEADGTIRVPDRPGVGFTFDRDRIEAHTF
ncbi:mandelate racemase/muconate lactonizing enzyme family protein [Acuticoccus sediminis]|uniref:mandelate racemase/muconate lactonizing enzyme family protein n=1 Tax=Acuticoccus sediminis TaxID=2184697 RepID=UPI001CFCD9AC|nr:mandelate racemase/muconate lactonizing enzyme family protein [Acuticoccus sediminis]